ncbi:hypothetical protein EMIT0215P_160093 [Pseudomonas serboccidentalis]
MGYGSRSWWVVGWGSLISVVAQTLNHLWRGSLLPLGRLAAPVFEEGPAAQSSGSKLPRHRFCASRD